MDLRGKRVTVMGLGRHGGGVAAARYAGGRGARVTVADLRSAKALSESITQLGDVPIDQMRHGEHHERDFIDADVVIVNPAVRLDAPILDAARSAGAEITSEIELFLRACPAPIIGVTGTNGKSTTAAMIAAILRTAGRTTWLGGNIGRSLLNELDTIQAADSVVLELSSFQLAWLSDSAPRPRIAVVTGCTPNHLDWHGQMSDYEQAKRRILSKEDDQVVVLGPTICVAEVARLWRSGGRPNSGEFGYFDERSNPEFADRVDDSELPPLLVPGAHNRANARLAATAALAAGCEWSAIQGGLKDFAGLAHRLEYLGQFGGLRCYNDSMATTPESVQAALASLAGPIWLLAGGRNKGADLSPICVAAANLAAGVCFYGDSRRELSDGYSQLRLGAEKPPMGSVVTLAQAVAWCVKRAGAGDALLLSPGCSSLDQFADYRERAAVFEQLVRGLRVSVSTANRAATAV